MIALVHPSFWQRTAAGLAVILAVLLPGTLVLVWLTRAVLAPRAAGRAWPEGARWVRLVAEIVVDAQRRPVEEPGRMSGLVQAVRFGLVVATCAVVPLSSGLVITQPEVGVYLLALLLALDAVVVATFDPTSPRVAVCGARVGLAGVLGLSAGVAASQWGTASLAGIARLQATGEIFGVAGWGLMTAWVQPVMCVVAVAVLHTTNVLICTGAAEQRGGSTGLVADLVDQAFVVAGAAWLVAAWLGGGAVPWTIDNAGVHHAVSVVVFMAKLTAVAVGFAWARVTWPQVPTRWIRILLATGALVGSVSIIATVGIRTLV